MTVDALRHRSSFHHMAPALMTADELLHSNIPDKRTELIRGVLVVREPAGYNHGRVIAQLTGRLWSHVERSAAGQLLGAETGFTLFRDPDTVRAPDIAFVHRDRLPDPASRGSCFIGGNIAENSGGPKAVKYGVVKDYVLNLRIGAERLLEILDEALARIDKQIAATKQGRPWPREVAGA